MSCVIAVCAPADPPANITSPGAASVNENAVLAHALTASETVTWEIFGGLDAAKFEIIGSTLRWIGNGVKDFENPDDANGDNVYQITVTAIDEGFNATSQNIAITVLDVDDVPPTITSANAVSVEENATLAHTLTANETVTWALVGGADQARFELSGNVLRWVGNGTKNFELPDDSNLDNAYVVIVRATDTQGNPNAQTITVTVTDVVEWVALTFENGVNTNVTLSAGNLAAAPTSAAVAMAIAAEGWKRSGKWYFEGTHTDAGVNGEGCGIVPEGADIAKVTDATIYLNCVMVTAGAGAISARGYNTYPGASIGDLNTPGTTVAFAVDLENWRFWARKLASNATTTWNPNDKRSNITLSDGDTKAEVVSGGGTLSMVRATNGNTIGKYYFEVKCIGNMNANMSVGIANLSASLTSYLGSSNNSISLNMAGTVFRNNTNVGGVGAVVAQNDVISIAFDLDNSMIWFRVNGGIWNNNASANPATNTGGITTSAITGVKYPAWNGYTDFSGAPPIHDTCMANFGQAAFAYAVPLGFNAGWIAVPSYWNNNPAADPALNTGGIDISYLASTRVAPMAQFLAGSFSQGAKWTCNFGASAFASAVPVGFNPGWSKGVETALGHPTYAYLASSTFAVIEKGEQLSSKPASGVSISHPALNHFKSSGKYYIEFDIVNGSGNGDGVGFMTHDATAANVQTAGTNTAMMYFTGAIYSNDVNTGIGLGQRANGNTIGAAIDFENDRAWFRVAPSGNWNNNASGNPTNNVGGVSLSNYAAKLMGPVIANASFTVPIYIANLGERAFLGAVPAEFTAGWPLTKMTWNAVDKSANVTLSNSFWTATTTTASWGSVRAFTTRSSGKHYWEFTTTLTTIPSFVGLAPASTALPIGYNAANGSAGLDGLGAIRINGSTVTGSIGDLSPAGAKVRCAVDLDAKLIWFEVIGSGAGWNGATGAADPAAGTGGRSISGMTLPAAPHFTGGASGNSAIVNLGATAFTGALPSGFSAWG